MNKKNPYFKDLSFLNIIVICAFTIVLSGCGNKTKTDNTSASQSPGDINSAQIEKDVIASLADEGEDHFEVQFRTDEKTKTGTEIFGTYGPIPYQIYFVRSKSNWKYKGHILDVYRHLEVKYYKINGDWTLDKARVFNSWLDKVQNPINESTITTLIKSNTWQSFGHNNAEIESIALVSDFYNMPGIENGILYPAEFSSKKVNCLVDIVFTDGAKKKGRYEIKFARDAVDQSWDKVISYRRVDEENL